MCKSERFFTFFTFTVSNTVNNVHYHLIAYEQTRSKSAVARAGDRSAKFTAIQFPHRARDAIQSSTCRVIRDALLNCTRLPRSCVHVIFILHFYRLHSAARRATTRSRSRLSRRQMTDESNNDEISDSARLGLIRRFSRRVLRKKRKKKEKETFGFTNVHE